jgi:hypothetical protein
MSSLDNEYLVLDTEINNETNIFETNIVYVRTWEKYGALKLFYEHIICIYK